MKELSKEQKTTMGYIIIGICCFILAVSAITAFVLTGDDSDPETFCKGEVLAHTIIVLDKTDPLTTAQQKFMFHYINKEKKQLKKFEKLSIFILTENTYANLEPIFSKCNPGAGENANPLYQNPQMLKMRFDNDFSKPLKNNMNSLLFDSTGSKSTIFEMIRELTFRDDFGESIKNRKLIIFSDMMHHTPEYSHYKNKIDYHYFSKKLYADEVAANLNFVNVKIVYLLRDKSKHKQGKRHLLFWKNYFQTMGAQLTEVRNVR
ncbi:hypothetical protein QUF70_03855 [Desulfobacterales bacterium HSG17]|nr:hypothetical protein [Desulfobacterales bacterium HSG17]